MVPQLITRILTDQQGLFLIFTIPTGNMKHGFLMRIEGKGFGEDGDSHLSLENKLWFLVIILGG